MKIFDQNPDLPTKKISRWKESFLGSLGKGKGSPEGEDRKGGGNALHFIFGLLASRCCALPCPALCSPFLALAWGPLHLSFTPHTAPRLGRPPWLMLSSMDYFKLLSSSSASNIGTRTPANERLSIKILLRLR